MRNSGFPQRRTIMLTDRQHCNEWTDVSGDGACLKIWICEDTTHGSQAQIANGYKPELAIATTGWYLYVHRQLADSQKKITKLYNSLQQVKRG